MTGSRQGCFDLILKSVSTELSKLGFRKTGSTFRKVMNDGVAIVNFQRSVDSKRNEIKFTVNFAVVCLLLQDNEKITATVSEYDGHLRQRIGAFLPGHPDKWWVVKEKADPQPLIDEIQPTIVATAVPFVTRYTDAKELLALWESGNAPGLTEGARQQHIARLNRALAN